MGVLVGCPAFMSKAPNATATLTMTACTFSSQMPDPARAMTYHMAVYAEETGQLLNATCCTFRGWGIHCKTEMATHLQVHVLRSWWPGRIR